MAEYIVWLDLFFPNIPEFYLKDDNDEENVDNRKKKRKDKREKTKKKKE